MRYEVLKSTKTPPGASMDFLVYQLFMIADRFPPDRRDHPPVFRDMFKIPFSLFYSLECTIPFARFRVLNVYDPHDF